jgi:hypothetical protein
MGTKSGRGWLNILQLHENAPARLIGVWRPSRRGAVTPGQQPPAVSADRFHYSRERDWLFEKTLEGPRCGRGSSSRGLERSGLTTLPGAAKRSRVARVRPRACPRSRGSSCRPRRTSPSARFRRCLDRPLRGDRYGRCAVRAPGRPRGHRCARRTSSPAQA